MPEKISRRNFVTQLAITTAAVPFISKPGRAKEHVIRSNGKTPIIVCSRSGDWAKKVLDPAWDVWQEKGNMMDAVERGANVVELDPDDGSVGYGGLPNEEGEVELDASVMHGPTRNAGSVAGIKYIKTPSSVARLVMERTNHVMLVGQGALDFALAHGFKKENLLTEKARVAWLKWKENLSDKDDWFPPKGGDYSDEYKNRPTGTINVLGVDDKGDIFGITTTSGLAFKIPGRVGDSPIIGAGLYLDNDVGAAGATGRGEEIIKTCASFLIVEKMREGMSPQKACEYVCRRIIDMHGGKVTFGEKLVAVNKNGDVGCAMLHQGGEVNCSFITSEGIGGIRGHHFFDR